MGRRLRVWLLLAAREVLGSIPYLTLLEVEILAFYTVSQNLHLLTRSEARTIHTAKKNSLGHGQIHGTKKELQHMAPKS